MDKTALLKEAEAFNDKIFRERAEKFLTDDAGAHFDATPQLQQSFCGTPFPNAAQIVAAKARYVAVTLKGVRDDSACPPALK